MKTLTRRQRVVLFVLIALFTIVAVLILSMLPSLSGGRASGDSSVTVEIPEADLEEDPATKTDSYRRTGGISDYWEKLNGDDGSPGSPAASPSGEGRDGGRKPPQVAVEDLFGNYAGQETPPPAARHGGSATRSGAGGRKATSSENTTPAATEPAPSEEPTREPDRRTETPPLAPIKRSGAVSNLDTDVSRDLGNGFSTLDGTDMWVSGEAGKPYRCMFTRDEKVRSGQRVSLRLLEDLVTGGVHIPRNTHLQGVVSISDRMEIAVTSLDMGGRILSLHFEAFDTDGGKGIYCSDLSQTRKSITEQGLATISSTLSSVLGRVARDAASVGASIVRNKNGEATVTVPAGYTFYLIEQQR